MADGTAAHLDVAPGVRSLKRELGPLAWAVLEDIALDARVDDDGRLVAATSSRRVAEHLGLTAGTAARALARLRSLGLVDHSRQSGPSGRFGLSLYVLGPLPGVEVVVAAGGPPAVARPGVGVETPLTAQPCSIRPRPAATRAAGQHTAPAGEGDDGVPGSAPGSPLADVNPDQLTLLTVDLPLGNPRR